LALSEINKTVEHLKTKSNQKQKPG